MRLLVAHCSDRGGRAENQDYVGFHANEVIGCFVLADGVGGHSGGALASRSAVAGALTQFGHTPAVDRPGLERVIHSAREALTDTRRQHPEAADMNTTIATLLVDTGRGQALWSHLGDSRIYLFRNGRAHALTRDHSVLQALIDAGMAGGRDTAERNALYASVGTDEIPPQALCEAPLEIRAGDAFLLCSDGFWEALDEGTMEAALAESTLPEQWVQDMVGRIAAPRAQGQDNFSAMAVWIGDRVEITRIQPPRPVPAGRQV